MGYGNLRRWNCEEKSFYMAAINTVTLIGRVVRDIEVNSTTWQVRSLIRTSG